jgi:Fe-S cluster assembly iron-binding protein IscA
MALKIEVTNEARDQVRQLIQSQKPGTAVRVFMQAGGGGCGCGDGGCGAGESSGPSFGMAFDKARNGDQVVPVDGFSVVVDSTTAEMLEGAKIDFVQSLHESGFQIVPKGGTAPTPSAGGGGCGCGSGGCC